MAPNSNTTSLSNWEVARLQQRLLDAQNQIHIAKGQILQAQHCLHEINSILSKHAVKTAASSPTAPKDTLKVSESRGDDPAVESSVSDAQAKSGEAKFPNNPAREESIDDTIRVARSSNSKFNSSAMTTEQAAFLRFVLGNIKRTKHVSHFLNPVDYVALELPTYPDEIEHPMDIGTMNTKLYGNEYLSVQAFVDDLQLIVDNAKTFNGPTHNITHAAYVMLAYAHEKLEKLPPSEGIALKPHGRKRKGSV
jgi:bromodomain-containing factor 1